MTGGFMSKNRVRERTSQVPSNGKMKMGILGRCDHETGSAQEDWGPIESEANFEPAMREMTGDYINAGPPYTDGSNFDNIKIMTPQHTLLGVGEYRFHNSYNPSSTDWVWKGGFGQPLHPDSIGYDNWVFNFSDVLSNPVYFPDLSSLGSAAYRRLRPSLSTANVGEMIAEGREFLPMLKQSARGFSQQWKEMGGDLKKMKMQPKRIANDFLLYQFGWKPFLKDMSSLLKAFNESSAAYKEKRYFFNDKWKRRLRREERISDDALIYERTDTIGCQPEHGMFSGIAPGFKRYTIRRKSFTDVWYEGQFKTYIRVFDRANSDASIFSLDELHRSMNQFGAYVSPAVLYRTTPWTWLGDWFTNVGDLVQEAEDRLTGTVVSKYMYLMHHKWSALEYRSQFSTADAKMVDVAWYRATETKRRLKAGTNFDFSLSSLTARQIAILAALGITKR